MPKEVKQKPRFEVDSKREEEARARREFGIERLTEGEELIDEDSFSEMHAKLTRGQTNWGEPVSEAEASEIGVDDLLMAESASGDAGSSGVHQQAGPPDHPGEVVGLERDLLVARSREEIVHLALRIARYHARAAALFVVQRDMVAGIRGSGDGMQDGIEGVMIPSGIESRIARPIETNRLTRVWAPLEGVDERVLKGLGRSDAKEFAVFPIVIADRVMNLLYVDNGPDPMPETSIGALLVLCSGIGRAYQRMILKRKSALSECMQCRRASERLTTMPGRSSCNFLRISSSRRTVSSGTWAPASCSSGRCA